MKTYSIFLIVLMAVAGGACSTFPAGYQVEPEDTPTGGVSPSPTPPTQPASTGEIQPDPSQPTPANSSMEIAIKKASEDLAQRLSIRSEQINLVEVKAVTWSDSSLGCPQPGMAYTDVLTPGYLIVFEYADNQHEYHSGKGLDFTYCPNPQPPVPNDPGNT